jgi:DNA-binding XRE family transcriptional regulator
LGFTQESLLETIKFSTQSLSAIENGRQSAHLDTYLKIANALSLPMHMLFLESSAQEDAFAREVQSLFTGYTVDEKTAMLRILWEIKSLMRSKQL